jgi:hypothetical protein
MNRQRSFIDQRRLNKHKKSITKGGLGGNTQEISGDSSLTDKERTISHNSQEILEHQHKKNFGRDTQISNRIGSQVHVVDVDSVTSHELLPSTRRNFCNNLSAILCKYKVETQDQLIQRYFGKKKAQANVQNSFDVVCES